MTRKPTSSLTTGAFALMAATIITNALGLAFWGLAAHLKPAREIGPASAAVSALALLATVGQLNLTNVFLRLLPGAGRLARYLVDRGYVATVVMCLAAGGVYVGTGLSHGILGPSWLGRLTFVLAVVVLAIFALQDAVLIALRLTVWVPIENASSAIAKLVLLPMLVFLPGGSGVVVASVVPAAVAVIVVSLLLQKRVFPAREHLDGSLPSRRRLLNFIAGEYLGNICATAAAQVMPLLVVWRLGASAAAYFTLPWLISIGVSLLMWNVSASFVVELATARSHSRELVRRSGMLLGAIVLVTLLVCGLGAHILLETLGPMYARHGETLLRLIGVSAPFTAIVIIYSTLAWVDQRVWLLAAILAGSCIALLSSSLVLLPKMGVTGVGWAYLFVQIVSAAVMVPPIVKRLYRGPLTPPPFRDIRHPRPKSRETMLTPVSDGPMRVSGTRSRTESTAYIGITCSVLVLAFVYASPWHWLKLVGAMILACVPAGAAIMCWIDAGEGVAQAGLTLTLSLTTMALLSALMIWTSTWHPYILMIIVTIATVLSCGERARQGTSR
jgi:O-antigen/teichoic acid export membrane protein